MISNRESARRSRMKREQHIKDLTDRVTYYITRRGHMVQKMNNILEKCTVTESENRMLRMRVQELKERLELLEQILDSHNSSDHDAMTN